MLGPAILLGLCLVGADGPPASAPATATDRVTLRDGSVVLGTGDVHHAGPARWLGGISGTASLGREEPRSADAAVGPFQCGDNETGYQSATKATGELEARPCTSC